MPTPKLSALGALTIGGETTFGTLATYTDYLRCQSFDRSGLTAEVLPNEYQRATDHEVARVLGPKVGSVALKFSLHGFDTSVPSAAPTLTESDQSAATGMHHLLNLLGSAFGDIETAGYKGSTSVGVSGTDPKSITCADLASFIVGQMIAWATALTPKAYECGWIKSIDTTASPDEAVLTHLPTVDPQGATIWGSHNVFVTDGDQYHGGNVKSWSLIFQGHAADDKLICLGCQPTNVKITAEAGKVPMLEITMGVAHWYEVGSGGGPSVSAWSYPAPEQVCNWSFTLDGTQISARSFEFDLGLTRNPLPGGASQSGVEGWFAVTRRPTLSFQLYRTLAGEVADFRLQTSRVAAVHWGSQPGRLFGLLLPAARVVEFPKPTDRDGAVVSDVKLEAHYYAGDTGGSSTQPANSLARFAFA